MDRRKFIKGTVAAAVAAAIPVGDGVELYSIAHPVHKETLKFPRQELENSLVTPEELGRRMAEALAKSMSQTREQVATRVFWDHEADFLHVEGISREQMYVS